MLKSGIGARLNTKNTNNNMMMGGSIGAGGRMNAHSSYSGSNNVAGGPAVSQNALKQSMNKSIQLNTNFYNNNRQMSGNSQTANGKQSNNISGQNAQ